MSHNNSSTPLPTVGVVVPTVNRPQSLRRLVDSLQSQTHPPASITISVPPDGLVPADVRRHPLTLVVTSPKGASAQRNSAVAELRPMPELVAFFDDDTMLAPDYLEQASAFLASHPDHLGVTGHVLRDGAAEKRQLSFPEMLKALAHQEPSDSGDTWRDVPELYGCNMVIRSSALEDRPFDERLPLYSWLEDLDLSHRLARNGRLAHLSACRAVHEGSATGGRAQHRRLGYSQVVNPLYLHCKGSLSTRDTLRLVLKPATANIIRSVLPREGRWRRQRLRGMVLAVHDVMRRRASPERVLDIQA